MVIITGWKLMNEKLEFCQLEKVFIYLWYDISLYQWGFQFACVPSVWRNSEELYEWFILEESFSKMLQTHQMLSIDMVIELIFI